MLQAKILIGNRILRSRRARSRADKGSLFVYQEPHPGKEQNLLPLSDIPALAAIRSLLPVLTETRACQASVEIPAASRLTAAIVRFSESGDATPHSKATSALPNSELST